jgi:hypothetical protein
VPPSCQASGPGLTDCGASSESCCTSLDVPGGTYFLSYRSSSGEYLSSSGDTPSPTDPATASGFRLDKYLVTVGRFRQFVNAVLPADGGTGWVPAAGVRQAHALNLNGGNGLNATGGGHEPGWVATDNQSPSASNWIAWSAANNIPPLPRSTGSGVNLE